MIQSCQHIPVGHQTAPNRDARRAEPPAPNFQPDNLPGAHIELIRPHTILLLATVAGGQAERHLFTGIIAQSIRQVDGKKDFYEIFKQAAREMECERPEQHPLLQSTLKKELILPVERDNMAI